jgi:hypothetical protein
MKYVQACVLCAIALIIIVGAVVPSLGNLIGGLGVEIPSRFARLADSRFAHSYPMALLIVGLTLLALVAYALWRTVLFK